MKKINSRASTLLSIIFTSGLIALLTVTLFFIPKIVDFVVFTQAIMSIGTTPKLFFMIPLEFELEYESLKLIIVTIVYILNILGLITAGLLLFLLRNVKKDEIFIKTNVSYLRACSWLCIVAGILFFILGSLFWTGLLLAFAAGLVGLMLRVVKNIIERAVELKEENDLTI